jgi:hypothetical protein
VGAGRVRPGLSVVESVIDRSRPSSRAGFQQLDPDARSDFIHATPGCEIMSETGDTRSCLAVRPQGGQHDARGVQPLMLKTGVWVDGISWDRGRIRRPCAQCSSAVPQRTVT